MVFAMSTKYEFITDMSKKTGMTRADCETALNTVIDQVEVSLKKGNKVTFAGFGTFQVTKRKKRKGVDPRTGAKIDIPAAKVVKFKPSKTLKDKVNKRSKK